MKKLKIILYTLCLISLSILNVYAKETIKTCEYYKPYDQLSGSEQVSVLCNIYNDFSHECYMAVGKDKATTKDNDEKIQNWGKAVGLDWQAKKYVQENNKCPDYMIIRIKNNAWFNAGGYMLHAAQSYEEAQALIKHLNASDHHQRYIASSKDLEISEGQKKSAQNQIQMYIDDINKTMIDYSLDTCADQENVFTRYSKCNDIISAFKSRVATADENVSTFIKMNYFTEEDDIIKNYREKTKKADEFIINEETVLEEKKQEIQDIIDGTKKEEDEQPVEKEETAQIEGFCKEPKILKAFQFIGYLLLIVKIVIPILLIVLGSVDFIKAIISSDADAVKKSTNALIFRVIAGVVIFFLPTIINFTFKLVSGNKASNMEQCRTCIFHPNRCD